MRIERKRVSELKRAPYNPRVELQPGMEGFERLARSLREFDLVQPLVWNERTGHVVGGHQRLSVLREEGVEEVECVVVDLPLAREKGLNVALNNERVGGDWDVGKLTSLISELRSIEGFDPTTTGFSLEEMKELVFRPEEGAEWKEVEEGDDRVKVTMLIAPKKWGGVKRGLDGLLSKHPGVEVHVDLGKRKKK